MTAPAPYVPPEFVPDEEIVLGSPPTCDADGWFYKEGRFAVMGLREITNWRVETRRTRDQGDGSMAGTATTTEEAQPQPAAKVETAARMLAEVADELGAIATYEPAGDRVHGTPVPGEEEI